jgi:hypothetical protein
MATAAAGWVFAWLRAFRPSAALMLAHLAVNESAAAALARGLLRNTGQQ